MRDFADTLGERLDALAGELAASAPEIAAAPRTKPRPLRLRRPAILGTLTTGVAAVGAFFALSGTSLAQLPILSTPTTDASSIRASVPQVASQGVDFGKAHRFATPGGPGYVLVDRTHSTICLVVPDPGVSDSFGSSCSTPLSRVERSGMKAELVGDRSSDPNATTTFAFVLPEGATDVHLVGGAPTAPLHIESGVAVGSLTKAGFLTWVVDGVRASKDFDGPFTNSRITCPNGNGSVPMTDELLRPGRNGAPPNLDTTALAKACR
ncbi:MAG: hypothetical protein AAGC46_08745 [Solirubrobacteraceae bacterium]